MTFIRLALMTPKRGREANVEKLLNDLAALHRSQPGFVAEYLLQPDPHQQDSRRLGRIAIWESEAAANRVSMLDRDITLKAQLKLDVDDATHEEHSFAARDSA